MTLLKDVTLVIASRAIPGSADLWKRNCRGEGIDHLQSLVEEAVFLLTQSIVLARQQLLPLILLLQIKVLSKLKDVSRFS